MSVRRTVILVVVVTWRASRRWWWTSAPCHGRHGRSMCCRRSGGNAGSHPRIWGVVGRCVGCQSGGWCLWWQLVRVSARATPYLCRCPLPRIVRLVVIVRIARRGTSRRGSHRWLSRRGGTIAFSGPCDPASGRRLAGLDGPDIDIMFRCDGGFDVQDRMADALAEVLRSLAKIRLLGTSGAGALARHHG